MNGPLSWPRALKWAVLALLALTGALMLLLVALDQGYLKEPLRRFIAASAGRSIRIDGPLRMHLLSRQPLLIAEHVIIGNPPWTRPGTAAEIGKVTLKYASLRFGAIEKLEIEAANVHLVRDSTGHANWQWTDPDRGPVRGLPLIRALSVAGAHVQLDDALRHVQFDGKMRAAEVDGSAGAQRLRIEGAGKLNGRTATFDITGDPLGSARRNKPYGFTFAARSSGSRLSGQGSLLRPFDLKAFDASFEATGRNLKDLYYLVGVTFVDTGGYHISGKLEHRGYDSAFSDLGLTFGQSDIRGSASVKMAGGQSNMTAELHSQLLRMSDLGARAAARGAEGDSAQKETAQGDSTEEESVPGESARGVLLSNATWDLSSLRRIRAGVHYRASRVEAGRVTLFNVTATVAIDRGVLELAPLSGELLEGKLSAQFKVDARGEIPQIAIDGRIDDVQLGQYKHDGSGAPAIEGPLSAKFTLTGRGNSIHQVAAGADGAISATLAGGAVRDSFAELTGVDFRGLGLLLTKNQKEVPVRCGLADFKIQNGTMRAQKLVLDTDPVLITGDGNVHLDSEDLDLVLHGQPKSTRFLRLSAPLQIRGTLRHPSISIQSHDASLKLVDRGKATDAGCELLPK
jgi:AsmA family protein